MHAVYEHTKQACAKLVDVWGYPLLSFYARNAFAVCLHQLTMQVSMRQVIFSLVCINEKRLLSPEGVKTTTPED
jgi:hypothetical protein